MATKTANKRAEILAKHGALRGEYAPGTWKSRQKLEEEYLGALPMVSISRCPYSGALLTMAIDTAGLDGLFWDEMAPIRPLDGNRPGTFFALTGAMKLNGAPARAPFPCTPGPGAPFVVPRMLLHPDVKAAISHLSIGEHDAYPVVYYASPMPDYLRRFNDWGTNEFRYETEDDPDLFDSIEEEDEDIDFDLALWIERGDLRWIAPGDAGLELKTDVEGCPYLGIEGRHDFYWIQDGKIASAADAAATPARTRKRRSKT